MDSKQGKNIDDLFRQKLGQMEVAPGFQAWDKLEQRLDEGKKPLWVYLGRMVAGLALVIGIGAILYQMTANNQVEEFIVQNEVQPDLNENRVLPSEEKVEQEVEEEEPVQETIISKRPEPKRRPPIDKTRPSGRVPVEESQPLRQEIPLIALPIMELVDVDLGDLMVEELRSTAPLPVENEIEYKVRIVSRGYAIAPDKGDLVDGIENQVVKISTFFTKVDQGFADLQDAKNDFFAFMTTKKEKQEN